MRVHQGINQITGKLKKGYFYTGKKLKSGMPEIGKTKPIAKRLTVADIFGKKKCLKHFETFAKERCFYENIPCYKQVLMALKTERVGDVVRILQIIEEDEVNVGNMIKKILTEDVRGDTFKKINVIRLRNQLEENIASQIPSFTKKYNKTIKK